jgi:hypothetical protein
MADFIKCHLCGQSNPADQEFCQRCQARLSPPADDSIKPGQIPTKKTTAELEPVLPQWLREARESARKSAEEDSGSLSMQHPQDARSAPSGGDLLAGLRSQAEGDEEEDIPDWLANITGTAAKTGEPQVGAPEIRWDAPATEDSTGEDGAASWLEKLTGSQPQPGEKDELTEWFRSEGGSPQAASEEAPPASGATTDEEPDWMGRLGALRDEAQSAESAPFSESGAGREEAFDLSSIEIPEWMKGQAQEEKPIQDTHPKWLKEEAGVASQPETPPWLSQPGAEAPPPAKPEKTPPSEAFGDLPAWLRAAAPQSSMYELPEEEEAKPPAEPVKPFETPPAFTDQGQPGGSADEFFAEMPDWLSGAADEQPPSTPRTGEAADGIAPGELPSWVQAMRPVEAADSRTGAGSLASDQTLESRGALAGLHGVLPAATGFSPTSKPKAYSMKLNASEEQLAHASILEQVLAAEAEPVPITSFTVLRTSRRLRWFIAFVLLAVVGVPLFLGTQFFSMPVGFPNELRDALTIAQSIPENAPVLAAFDYAPARAGEMEAAAAPMFDQMLLLRHPRLTFIATNETGALLAERFISGPLGLHNYQSRVTYLNLGYLPGGQMGIRAFAQNPAAAALMDVSLQPAWTSAPLEGVTSLSQFAALILITDNADAARAWVEQTESARGNVPFVVVSSAQAAPMIQPYYESRQIHGLVSGLYGGALFEGQNAGRPGFARAYWDAYSLGVLLAMVLVVGGGFWNFALALRERAAAGEAA